MEWCNRGDLQALVKKAKAKDIACLKEHVTWNLGLQVILGLHYLHEKHILHRDLKSANVFLQKDAKHQYFSVKIGDLGVAKLLETSTAFAQTIVGTPYYLSPELVADQPYRDKSDCWALGVLLYECCTLCHPFEARNQCALIMKIMQSPVKPPPEATVSPQLCRLILWLLQKDPNKRPRIRDILSETYIQEKLKEHGFELPTGILGNEKVLSVLNTQVPIDQSARYRHAGDELDDNENTINNNNRGNFNKSGKDRDRDDDDYKADYQGGEEDEGIDRGRDDENSQGNTIIKNANDRSDALNKSYHQEERITTTAPATATATAAANAAAKAVTKDRVGKDDLEEKHAANYNSQDSSDSDGTPGNVRNTSATHRASTGGAVPSRLQQRAVNNTVQIRGNRVRGGGNVERNTSSKVLTRHQVQAPPAQVPRSSASTGTSIGIGKINAVSSGTDDYHSPVHHAESKQGPEHGRASLAAADLGRSFKANELSASLAAARATNAETTATDLADSKAVLNTNNTMLNRSFKELDLAETKITLINGNNGNNGGAVSNTPRKQDVEPDVLYAPDFETTISVAKPPRREAKASAKDVYEHTNDATISQQVGLLSRKNSAHTNTHADAVSKSKAIADEDIDDTVVTTVEIVNRLGETMGNDDAIQDDIKATDGGTTDSSTQSTMNTVNTLLSKGSNGMSGPLVEANANAFLPARERRESCEDVAPYEDDFEDYDDELVNLYQPQEGHQEQEGEGEYYNDEEEEADEQRGQLSAEYLAHFGTGAVRSSVKLVPKGAQPKAAGKIEEDEFKASLRQELKLDSKDVVANHRQHGENVGVCDETNNSDHMSNDSLEDDPFEARREIDEMLYWIADTREILTKSLGADLFQTIYTLCKDNMTEQLGSSKGTKDVSYLHEIQKKLQDHLHASLEAVLGTVMQVKALLAWEEELARKNLGLDSEAVNFLKEF